MFSLSIVVAFEVVEDLGARICLVLETPALEHFVFEGADEGLGPSVVVGIGPRRHALAQAGFLQEAAVGDAAILAASITVEDGWSAWCAGLDGLA